MNRLEQIKPLIEEQTHSEETIKKMNSFIFDENEVIVEKNFCFSTFTDTNKEEVAAWGIFLPKNATKYDKNNQPIGDEQINVPVLITSNNNLLEIGSNIEKRYKIRYDIPTTYPRRWSLPSIKKYLKKEHDKVDGIKLFTKIRRKYERYLYYSRQEWYTIHALWDFGTYSFFLFKYYPILELRGLKSTAKSKTMTISRKITFNATEEMTNPSESTLFRETHEKRCTKYIDEAEKLFVDNKGKVIADLRAELINSSYKYTGTVPRQEKIGEKYRTVYYYTYSPTVLASINGLFGATEDRAIVHITTKPPKNDSRGEQEPEEIEEEDQEIRDDLYIFTLQNWKIIKKTYDNLKIPNFKNRDFWLWKPLLSLAKIIDEKIFNELYEFAQEQTKIKNIDTIPVGSTEYQILEITYELVKKCRAQPILAKEIADKWNGDYKPANKTICNFLDKTGFRDYKKHTREGNGYDLSVELFERIALQICPSIFIHEDSPSSHSIQLIEENIETDNQNEKQEK